MYRALSCLLRFIAQAPPSGRIDFGKVRSLHIMVRGPSLAVTKKARMLLTATAAMFTSRVS